MVIRLIAKKEMTSPSASLELKQTECRSGQCKGAGLVPTAQPVIANALDLASDLTAEEFSPVFQLTIRLQWQTSPRWLYTLHMPFQYCHCLSVLTLAVLS